MEEIFLVCRPLLPSSKSIVFGCTSETAFDTVWCRENVSFDAPKRRIEHSKYDYARRRLQTKSNERKNCNLTEFILRWDVPRKLSTSGEEKKCVAATTTHKHVCCAVDLNRFFKCVFFVLRIENDIDMLLGYTHQIDADKHCAWCGRQRCADKPHFFLFVRWFETERCHFCLSFSSSAVESDTEFFFLE